MPAETAAHERTVMCWPCRPQIYPGPADGRRRSRPRRGRPHDRRVRAGDDDRPAGFGAALRRSACGGGVDVVELAIDDSWFRDTGPIVVTDGAGGRLALDWVFNCWGDKWAPYGDDATIAARLGVGRGPRRALAADGARGRVA